MVVYGVLRFANVFEWFQSVSIVSIVFLIFQSFPTLFECFCGASQCFSCFLFKVVVFVVCFLYLRSMYLIAFDMHFQWFPMLSRGFINICQYLSMLCCMCCMLFQYCFWVSWMRFDAFLWAWMLVNAVNAFQYWCDACQWVRGRGKEEGSGRWRDTREREGGRVLFDIFHTPSYTFIYFYHILQNDQYKESEGQRKTQNLS